MPLFFYFQQSRVVCVFNPQTTGVDKVIASESNMMMIMMVIINNIITASWSNCTQVCYFGEKQNETFWPVNLVAVHWLPGAAIPIDCCHFKVAVSSVLFILNLIFIICFSLSSATYLTEIESKLAGRQPFIIISVQHCNIKDKAIISGNDTDPFIIQLDVGLLRLFLMMIDD